MQVQVLVAGAGPTGLTLGVELARRGIAVRVVDSAETFAVGSRGDGLQPRTLEVFEDIGVLDAVLAAGAPPCPTKVYVGGRPVGERTMGPPAEPTPAVPYPTAWFLGQSRTEAILRERLAGLGVPVELGTALAGFTQDTGGVTARLGTGEVVRVDYLVGADGGRSTVRRALGVAFEGSTDESVRMLLGDVRADGLHHAHGHWLGAADDPMRGVVFSPLPGTPHFQFGAPLDPGEAEPGTELAAVQARVDEVAGELGVRLHDLVWSTVWRPNVRLAARFRVGRVFLAGDAAHAHPPTGGQGLNTGVQDAYNLGWKLADGAPDLLDSYEAERRAVAAHVLGLSTRSMRKHLDGDADAHERGREYHQLDLTYRDGPLAAPGTGELRSGDRAPDAPLLDAHGTRVRLFELFRGPHATRLVLGDGPAPADGIPTYRIRPAGSHPAGGDLVDAAGHAFTAYGPGVTLVRPDGYVWSRPQAAA
ncbi:3-(3-hydroxyphenyl)propionate hydroxylase [Pseudonocardia sp. CNS-139]|nr:3-(3-hydroxyphenyl)propionate hydroxylase [Pseudonocardia sp. CNS-139]